MSSNKFYELIVPFDWEGEKAIGIDIDVSESRSERAFIPRSQVRSNAFGIFVSQWILERKREEFAQKGFEVADINRGLSDVFDWKSVIFEKGGPGASLPEPIDASALLAAFEKASQNLKFPKLLIAREDAYLKIKRAGEKAKNPGFLYLDNGASFDSPSRRFYGSVNLDGQFRPSRDCPAEVIDLVRKIGASAKDFAEIVGETGRDIGSCCFCSRELTDGRSTSVGYGPVCAENYGLPWGE